jgi:dihydroflavonol-4-reductase
VFETARSPEWLHVNGGTHKAETVLVTGGSGFIGGHLVEFLVRRGDRVRCLVRRTSQVRPLQGLGAELAWGDLAGKDDLAPALADVDVIYHAAGVTKPRRPGDYLRGNHRATTRLVAACRAAQERGLGRPRRLVFVSSLAAAGPCAGEPSSPVSLYGRSKLLAERAVQSPDNQVPWTIVRPPIVYGPRDTDFFLVIQAAARGLLVQMGRAEEKAFSLVHVRDLVRGLALMAASPDAVGRTYYLAHEQPCSWENLVGQLAQLLGRPVRTLWLPRPVGWLAGALSEFAGAFGRKGLILSRDKVREACQDRWVCDVSLAGRELGYRSELALTEGLAETIQWYRQEKWL